MDVTNQEEMVAAAVDVFVKGIVDADQSVLEAITADELLYGHSSGRVQNKADFIAEVQDTAAFDFVTGEVSDQTITVVGETAIVRHILNAETRSNGTPGSLSLGMILVWQNQGGEWILLARQAYRLPE
jgi:hypothetical protein